MSPSQIEQDTTFAGRYKIEREIGHGATAIVYRARDLAESRDVAIKVLRRELLESISSDRFLKEIRVASSIRDPHIVSVTDSGVHDGHFYCVMPFLDEGTLRNRLDREKQLPMDEALRIGATIARALETAHSQNLIHRDVKPENILFTAGEPCLADFGIARAIERATGDSTTSTGIVRGTPAYMSPEQAAGSLDYDGRSDIYSLGCVLYEMIAGVQAFMGPTPQSVVAQRLSHVPRALEVYRPNVPAVVEEVVERALAITAADRQASAAAFAEELERARAAIASGSARPRPRSAPRPRIMRRVGIGASALIIIVIALVWFSVARPSGLLGRGVVLDTSAVIVLPFQPSRAADSADAVLATARARTSLEEWRDLRVIDDRRTGEALRPLRGQGLTQSAALAAAASARARTLVWGTTARRGDSVDVQATIYDVAHDSALRSRSATYAVTRDSSGFSTVRRLTNDLLRGDVAAGAGRGPGEMPWVNATDRHQTSLAAWKSYDAGRAAILEWHLDRAEELFKAATASDPEIPLAHLWLAQTMIWRGGFPNREDRRAAATRALSGIARLSRYDELHARALASLVQLNMPPACDGFRAMRLVHPNDIAPWIGVADCEYFDKAGIRDAASPSGWRFRGSRADAERALEQAGRVAPASMDPEFRGWLFRRLQAVLSVDSLIAGNSADKSTDLVGIASFDHDTIVWIPWEPRDLVRARPPSAPAGGSTPADHRQRVLRHAAEQWVLHASESADAWEQLALLAETSGSIAVDGRAVSALDAAKKAAVLSHDSLAQVRLSIIETRLLLKEGRFSEARATADSALRAGAAHHPETHGVAGLAELLGRATLAAQLSGGTSSDTALEVSDRRHIALAAPLRDATWREEAYAALGIVPDSATLAQEAKLVASYVADTADARAVRIALLIRALTLSDPQARALSTRDRLRGLRAWPNLAVRAVLAIANDDRVGARSKLDSLNAQSDGRLPGAVAMDVTFRRVQAELAIGDTVAALTHLDAVLDGMPTLRPTLLDQVSQVGSLVRAMALRAELAAAQHDSATARTWAHAVTDLWQDADPQLQAIIRRMRDLQRS